MKIHKKILTHYLSCTSPVDKEGYLYKKKERNTSYQRRWFVLKANLLFYQERPADRHLLGVIFLEGCAVRHLECDGQFAFSLVFRGPGLKTYRLAAEDSQVQESWVKALLSVSHCYLSLLVRDLGRQYEGESVCVCGVAGGQLITGVLVFIPHEVVVLTHPYRCRQAEAKRETEPGESHQQHPTVSGQGMKDPNQSRATINSGSSLSMQGAGPLVREGRCTSATQTLLGNKMPVKVPGKRSPKLWTKRNAHVTPLNGPAPAFGEWPMIGLDSLEEFSTLHDYYGQEVRQLREDWRRKKEEEERQIEDNLFGLG